MRLCTVLLSGLLVLPACQKVTDGLKGKDGKDDDQGSGGETDAGTDDSTADDGGQDGDLGKDDPVGFTAENNTAFSRTLKASLIEKGALGLQDAADVSGLYFGELEIVAYDHRPGEQVQANAFWGKGTNWSYWIVLQSGHDAGRDNVLKVGGALDFDSLAGGYSMPVDETFASTVGHFDIDFFEVNFYRTGIIKDNKYFGMNAELNGLDQHPLHKYPEWSAIEDHNVMGRWPGTTGQQPTQAASVLFARSDWFPEPAIVEFTMNQDNTATWGSSSITMDATQQDMLLSLVNEGTGRRFYDTLIIVPYGDVVRSKFSVAVPPTGGSEPSPGTSTSTAPGDKAPPTVPNAGLIQEAIREIAASKLKITVDFDLTDTIADDSELTDTANLVLNYAGDEHNVPFGLKVTMDDTMEVPAATP